MIMQVVQLLLSFATGGAFGLIAIAQLPLEEN